MGFSWHSTNIAFCLHGFECNFMTRRSHSDTSVAGIPKTTVVLWDLRIRLSKSTTFFPKWLWEPSQMLESLTQLTGKHALCLTHKPPPFPCITGTRLPPRMKLPCWEQVARTTAREEVQWQEFTLLHHPVVCRDKACACNSLLCHLPWSPGRMARANN